MINLTELQHALLADQVVPYLGSSLLDMTPGGSPVPTTPEALAILLTSKVTVPHKIRKRLTAAAQYIENFKHRKSLTQNMALAFAPEVTPSAILRYLASLPQLSLLVTSWYDDAAQQALATRSQWGLVQGLSQSEHFGEWVGYYQPNGQVASKIEASAWRTLLYQPLGCVRPAGNYLVSDTDFVEVLTEIDIQTPIPEAVQQLRSGRHFLFIGCRFNDQLQRTFARQIMKRSSDRHWAILPDALTRNEQRFLTEQNITLIPLTLAEFACEMGISADALAA